MNAEQKLAVLKINLQLLTDSNDIYLKELLKQAESLMAREGIINDYTNDYDMAVVDYAAFLFRKRANGEKQMPKHLRYELNNILFSQKSK